jgi:hypothetical protein
LRVLSKESLWVCLCIRKSLLDKDVPRQRRIAGDIVFYTVRAVSKESRQLVLSRTSCFNVKN